VILPNVRSYQPFSKLLASSNRLIATRELMFVLLAGEIYDISSMLPNQAYSTLGAHCQMCSMMSGRGHLTLRGVAWCIGCACFGATTLVSNEIRLPCARNRGDLSRVSVSFWLWALDTRIFETPAGASGTQSNTESLAGWWIVRKLE
jgi:hypothetical protein